MIIETILENGLIERKSDKGVYIRNTITGAKHDVAVDIDNDKRIELGMSPYTYEETDEQVDDVGVRRGGDCLNADK